MRAAGFGAALVTGLVGTIVSPPHVRVIWNTTASVPLGLYLVTPGIPKRGDLLVLQLPPAMQTLAASRGMLSAKAPVLKPVAAIAGDRVCRWGTVVTINRRVAAFAHRTDARDRSLPVWQGCRQLSASQVFILAAHPDSFDSRYFGPLQLQGPYGVAHRLLTLQS